MESGILGFGIRNVAQGIRNPSSTDKEFGIQWLESGIHGVEFRIQHCLGGACLRLPVLMPLLKCSFSIPGLGLLQLRVVTIVFVFHKYKKTVG